MKKAGPNNFLSHLNILVKIPTLHRSPEIKQCVLGGSKAIKPSNEF